MLAVTGVISVILTLLSYVLLIMVVMSWLISFNIVNTRNQLVDVIWRTVNQLTEPLLRPIRRMLPPFSGLDISPIVLFLVILFLQLLLAQYIEPAIRRAGI